MITLKKHKKYKLVVGDTEYTFVVLDDSDATRLKIFFTVTKNPNKQYSTFEDEYLLQDIRLYVGSGKWVITDISHLPDELFEL